MKLIASLLLIVLTTAMIGGLTGAWFTDTDNAGTATFTAGTLSVDVSDGVANLEVARLSNMAPGEFTNEIAIEIKNTGSKNLAWFGDWVFTPGTPGADKLLDKIYIKSMGMYFKDAGGNKWNTDDWYSGYNFIENGRGNLLAHNALEAADFNRIADMDIIQIGENPLRERVITLRNFNNNSSMVNNVLYEHMGSLKQGGNKYILKVVFGFHNSANNDYQGDATGVSPITIGFNVDATQINADAMNELLQGLGTQHYGWMIGNLDMQP